MNIQKIIDELAYLLEINVEELHVDSELERFENWDSLAVVSMIAMIDQHFGILLDASELTNCKSLSQIVSYAQNKKSSQN